MITSLLGVQPPVSDDEIGGVLRAIDDRELADARCGGVAAARGTEMSGLTRSVSVVRAVTHNGPLRHAQLAFADFNTAEWTVWLVERRALS